MSNVFQKHNSNIKIHLSNKLIKEISLICMKSYPNETGGIIIGSYSSDFNTATISTITDAPSDSKMGKTWFKRGIIGLQELLDKKWSYQKEYYLGEWHFHPNGIPNPSHIDIQEMRKISKNPNYNCPEPILLIIGNRNDKWTLSIYVFFTDKSYSLISTIEF